MIIIFFGENVPIIIGSFIIYESNVFHIGNHIFIYKKKGNHILCVSQLEKIYLLINFKLKVHRYVQY